jgi:hypothetical protein
LNSGGGVGSRSRIFINQDSFRNLLHNVLEIPFQRFVLPESEILIFLLLLDKIVEKTYNEEKEDELR